MIPGLGKCWDEFNMGQYGKRDGAVRPVLQIAMPRSPRIYFPGATMQVGELGNDLSPTLTD